MTIYMGHGLKSWNFEDCTVREVENDYDLKCFEVSWEDNGKRYTQTVCPGDLDDYEGCVMALDYGDSPRDCWEDGLGHMVCTENAKEVE